MHANLKLSLATTIALLAGSTLQAAQINLDSDVTYYYYKPNVGINLSDLLAPDAFFTFGNRRYDSFSFGDVVGASLSASDFWVVFPGFSTHEPDLVSYPHRTTSTSGHVQFRVGWRLTELSGSKGFQFAGLQAGDVAIREGGEVRITQSLFADDGSLLGTQFAHLFGDVNTAGLHTTSFSKFDAQRAITSSFLVQIDKGEFVAFSSAFYLVPEPQTLAICFFGFALLTLRIMFLITRANLVASQGRVLAFRRDADGSRKGHLTRVGGGQKTRLGLSGHQCSPMPVGHISYLLSANRRSREAARSSCVTVVLMRLRSITLSPSPSGHSSWLWRR